MALVLTPNNGFAGRIRDSLHNSAPGTIVTVAIAESDYEESSF